jgi:hypothetical protein
LDGSAGTAIPYDTPSPLVATKSDTRPGKAGKPAAVSYESSMVKRTLNPAGPGAKACCS